MMAFRLRKGEPQGVPTPLLRTAQGSGDVLVHDNPALGALLKNHGPACVELCRRALLGSAVRAKSGSGPGKLARSNARAESFTLS